MGFLGVVLFLVGVSCQGLLFWRGWRWGGYRAYPLFYIYLSYTTFWTVALLSFPRMHPLYLKVYWDSELVAAALRFLVAWEVFRSVFRPASTRRIAGMVMFVLLVFFAAAFWLSGPSPGVSSIADFMRKIAVTVGVWMVFVLGMAKFYGIRFGKNIWGMAIGFLIFLSSEITNLAAFDLASWFAPIWRFFHTSAYIFMLAVWTWSLWNYAPNPQTEFDMSLGPQLLSKWQRQSVVLDETVKKVIRP